MITKNELLKLKIQYNLSFGELEAVGRYGRQYYFLLLTGKKPLNEKLGETVKNDIYRAAEERFKNGRIKVKQRDNYYRKKLKRGQKMKPKEFGMLDNGTGVIQKLKEFEMMDYKRSYILWKYVPDWFENKLTFKELVEKEKTFPINITEKMADRWLLEENVQNAISMLLNLGDVIK